MPQDLLRVSVDIVIFKIIENQLCVLVVKRATAPFIGQRCLPWWFIKENETIDDAAKRVLFKETWLWVSYVNQLWVFARVDRDPRRRAVWIWMYAVVDYEVRLSAWNTQAATQFCAVSAIPHLAFDHHDIFLKAYDKLKSDFSHWDIAQYFLPKYFTLWQLQLIYEIIWWVIYDKRNFRKLIASKLPIKKTSKKEFDVPHRPGWLYKF